MEELINNGVNQLGLLILVGIVCISTICILILKDVTDIKNMLKKHFKDEEKD